jgi:AcrR family transcriptional regulator
MARRSDHSKEDLKALALDAAEAILREHGLAHFSTRAVATRMGYTVGTLYHIFGNLNGLLLQLNARTLDAWYDSTLKSIAHTHAQQGHVIHALAQHYLSFAHSNRHVWLTLFEHRLPDDTPIPEWFAPKMQRFFDLLEAELTPYLPAAHIPQRARLLWSGIHGIVMLSLQNKLDVAGHDDASALCAGMVDALLEDS